MIVLTPYDILCMKNALNISSSEFLNRYTFSFIGDQGLPVVILKMLSDEHKSCPVLSAVTVARFNNARPWACRIYPLRPESTPETEKSRQEVLFCDGRSFLPWVPQRQKHMSYTNGLYRKDCLSMMKWKKPFKKITNNPRLAGTKITNTKIQQMFYMSML